MSKILEALAKLDIGNDNHWTADGNPRLDTVKFLSGDQTITREQLVAAAPTFGRANPVLGAVQAPQAVAATPAQGTPANVQAQAPQVAQNGGEPNLGGQASGGLTEEDGGNSEQDALTVAIAKAQADVEECRGILREVEKEFDARQKRLDDLLDEQVETGGKETTMDAIQGYLSSQRRANQERQARAKLIREMGLSSADLSLAGGSQLDKSMRRKTGFGNNRPGVK